MSWHFYDGLKCIKWCMSDVMLHYFCHNEVIACVLQKLLLLNLIQYFFNKSKFFDLSFSAIQLSDWSWRRRPNLRLRFQISTADTASASQVAHDTSRVRIKSNMFKKCKCPKGKCPKWKIVFRTLNKSINVKPNIQKAYVQRWSIACFLLIIFILFSSQYTF